MGVVGVIVDGVVDGVVELFVVFVLHSQMLQYWSHPGISLSQQSLPSN